MQEDAPLRPSSLSPHGAPHTAAPSKRRLALLLPLLPIAVVVAVWQLSDLSLLRSPERVAEAVGAVRDSPLGLVYVLLGFSIGTLVCVPITGLIIGTILAFGPLYGFFYGMLGTQAAAVCTYWAGRLSGSLALEYASGPRMTKLCEALRHRAFRASIIARLLPVGNFTVINVLAGSMRVPFRAFFFGNLIGLIPGLLFIALFAERISEVIRNPSRENLLLLGAVAVVLVGLTVSMRRYVRRSKNGRAAEEAHEGARP